MTILVNMIIASDVDETRYSVTASGGSGEVSGFLHKFYEDNNGGGTPVVGYWDEHTLRFTVVKNGGAG